MGMIFINQPNGAFPIQPHDVLRIYRIANNDDAYTCDCMECPPRRQGKNAAARWGGRTLADNLFWLCDECYVMLTLPELPDINLFGLLSDCNRKLDAILGGLNA